LLPKAGGKTENNTAIVVTVTKNEVFYIDKVKVSMLNLESELIKKVGLDVKKTIVIRADKEVSYKNVMHVIDIANKNKLKMILAVKGN